MALSRLVASLLLLSLLAIASADSSYGSYKREEKTDEDHQQPGYPFDQLHDQVEKMIGHSNPSQPESSDYVHQSEKGTYEHSTFPSQEDVEPTMPEGHEKFIPTKYFDGIDYIEIRGTILCKSGVSSYNAIPGAIAKITCPGWNENGYEYPPFSISSVTDKHGFYYATYPVSKLPKSDWMQLVKACQVIPEYSPLGFCNLPLFLNGGSDGAYVSYSRIVEDKAYYNAGSLFYTAPESSQDYPKESTIPEDTSLPAGGGY